MDILLVIDMQRDFINGALGTKEAEAIVPKVARRIKEAREKGETVFFTMDTHGADYMSTQEGQNLPVPHCIKGTPGWAMAPEILAEETESMPVFEKDCFGSLELSDALSRLAQANTLPKGRGMTIEVCGLCADICVVLAALMIKPVLPEARVVINRELTAGVTPEACEAALTVMKSCQVQVL